MCDFDMLATCCTEGLLREKGEHQQVHALQLTQIRQGCSSKAKLGIPIATASCLKLVCRMGRWIESSAQVYNCPQACH